MNKLGAIVVLLILIGGATWFYRDTAKTTSDESMNMGEVASSTTTGTPSASPTTSTTQPKTTTKPAVKPTTTGDKTGQQEAKVTTPTVQPQTSLLITYTDSGFTPAITTVAPGTTLEFVNRSTGLMWIASNPHPTHTGYPGFDALRAYGFGESYRFSISGAGKTYGYHNHLNPGKTGSVTVK